MTKKEHELFWELLDKLETPRKPFRRLLLHDDFPTGNFEFRFYGRDECGNIIVNTGIFTVPREMKKDFITTLWNDLQHYIKKDEGVKK